MAREQGRAAEPWRDDVDGSERLQTFSRKLNQRYYQLISDFAEWTGVPVVLNTSSIKTSPSFARPGAIDCFLKTRMDALYLGNYAVRRVQ